MLGAETISMMKLENDSWTKPLEITLSSKLNDFRDPSITPDGKKMFFLSKGKLPYQSKEKENIWYVEKLYEGWSEPQPLNEEINSHELHWQVSVASNGNLYFTSRDSNGFEDIYNSRFRENKYGKPEKLSKMINTTKLNETTPFISPDEKYLIFSRWKLRDEEGNWKKARKIEKIDYGLCPQVSIDQKYFFFMGMIDEKIKIMWAEAKIIEDLKPEHLK